MAKKIKTVYDRVNDYSKQHQSGFDMQSSFNGKINEAIKEIKSFLLSIHAVNERASELLQPYIKSDQITGSASAVFTKPGDYDYYLSASYQGKPVHKVSINQLDDYEQIPQRKGNLAKKKVNIAGVNNGWEGRPVSAYELRLNYLFIPAQQPELKQTLVSTEFEDRLDYDDTTTVDFLFDEKCIPLITYMVLQKLGVEIREQILMEYSQLGIAKENPAK